MKFDPKIHHRRSIRLQGYDYSQAGAYYVTIVVQGRACLLGEIVNGEMQLSRFGQIVQYVLFDLSKHYPHAELDVFCIMPNHVHVILVLNHNVLVKRHPLSEIIRGFKSFSAKRINVLRQTVGVPVWQRNYYEHIIRDAKDYEMKSNYILSNPQNWQNDNER